jgi:hypothetical protein
MSAWWSFLPHRQVSWSCPIPKNINYIEKIHIAISEIMMDSNGKNAISGGFEGKWSLYKLADFF